MQIHTRAPRVLQIGVVGLGYVGAVTAACLAKLGHRVFGFERDAGKVAQLQDGIAPFYEPGLNELLRSQRTAGRLIVCRELNGAVSDLDVLFICVGTPSRPDGAHDYAQLERVFQDVSTALGNCPPQRQLTIAVRSTVAPGTTEQLRARFFEPSAYVQFAYTPEFLREGRAVKDFFEPAFIAVGSDDLPSAESILAIYEPINAPKRVLKLKAAELLKCACNAFHALKVAFANETGTLAAAAGVDPNELMSLICEDTRLNISPAYLQPGFAFGGSCLPKDVRSLNHLARTSALHLPIYSSILPSNDGHLLRAASRVLAAGFKRAGLVGLSFKSQTDDVRESPALRLAGLLRTASVQVRAFDPDIRREMLHGANLQALEEVFGANHNALVADFEHLLGWADGLVLTKPISSLVAERIRTAGVRTIDLTRVEVATASAEQSPFHTVPAEHLRYENSLDLPHAPAPHQQRFSD